VEDDAGPGPEVGPVVACDVDDTEVEPPVAAVVLEASDVPVVAHDVSLLSSPPLPPAPDSRTMPSAQPLADAAAASANASAAERRRFRVG
jgi:hypothetical protein